MMKFERKLFIVERILLWSFFLKKFKGHNFKLSLGNMLVIELDLHMLVVNMYRKIDEDPMKTI